MSDVRALTIRQPWATLIASGVKTIETRSWATKWRGQLLIHAGKAKPVSVGPWHIPSDLALGVRMERSVDDGSPSGEGRVWETTPLPLGAIVAVADLTDCVPIVDRWDSGGNDDGGRVVMVNGDDSLRYTPVGDVSDQLPLGGFTPGRYAWILDNVRPLAEPVPARGRQGLWRPDETFIANVTGGDDE